MLLRMFESWSYRCSYLLIDEIEIWECSIGKYSDRLIIWCTLHLLLNTLCIHTRNIIQITTSRTRHGGLIITIPRSWYNRSFILILTLFDVPSWRLFWVILLWFWINLTLRVLDLNFYCLWDWFLASLIWILRREELSSFIHLQQLSCGYRGCSKCRYIRICGWVIQSINYFKWRTLLFRINWNLLLWEESRLWMIWLHISNLLVWQWGFQFE